MNRTLLALVASVAAVSLFAGVCPAHPGLDRQISDLTTRIEEQPREAELWLRRGELHRMHRDWSSAESDYRRAAELDPQLAVVQFCRGKMRFEAGRPREAKRALDQYLRARPDHAEGLALRGRALAGLGKHRAAAADFSAAISAAEGGRPKPEYYIERARALEAAGSKYLAQAIVGLDEGIERLGRPITLQVYAVDLEQKSGAYDAALARLERIAARSQRKERWHVRRGEILEQLGRSGQAVDAYRQALEAIQSLPASRRNTRAMERLQQAAQDALQRLQQEG